MLTKEPLFFTSSVLKWLKLWISMQENNILLVNLKNCKGCPFFMPLPLSKADTLLHNLTTANQRNPIFYFLCIKMTVFGISMQEKYHLIRQFKTLQVIPLFQAVSTSKADTVLFNLTTSNQITINRRFYFFRFS